MQTPTTHTNPHRCARIGCQEPPTCENETRIGERVTTAYLCLKHHEEVLAYAMRMQLLTGMPKISLSQIARSVPDMEVEP